MAEEPAPAGFSIYLLRHADAGDPGSWAGGDDERPLSKRGRKQARRLGRHLADLGVEIDVVLTSPKVRAVDTARLVGKELAVTAAEDRRLAGGFDPAGLRALLGELDGSATSAMLVGHDPDFSEIASWLTDAPLALRKGALARIDLAGRDVAAGGGALRWLLPPDAVRG
jgi:phosphohistidine phosphatase